MDEKIKFDAATKKWFAEHPRVETTVEQCDDCGLFYKPELGHECKKKHKELEFKPCPFCGGVVELLDFTGNSYGWNAFKIKCHKCQVSMFSREIHKSSDSNPYLKSVRMSNEEIEEVKVDLINAWNMRADNG